MSVSKRLKRYRGWIAFIALLTIAATVFAVTQAQTKSDTGPTYSTEAAAKGTLSVTITGTGNLQARETVDVSPHAAGTIASIEAAEGDAVKKGDVLYTLDRDAAEQSTAKALAAKRQADQSVSQAKLQVLQAETDYSNLRERSASTSSSITATDLKIASMKISSAKLGQASATASAKSADLVYDDAVRAENDLTVKAPCDGIVWAVNVAEGDLVTAGSTTSGSGTSGSNASATGSTQGTSSGVGAPVQIARDGELALMLAVNETDVPTLKAGQDAEIVFDAVPDLTLTGKVDSVGTKGTVSSGVVTYDVWIVLDVQDQRLRSGMSASATVITNVARNVLIVPNSAVKTASDGTKYVQLLASGAASPKNVTVTTGLSGASQTAIESGVREGDVVVTKTVTKTASSSSSGSKGSGGGFMMGGPGGGPGGN